MALRVNRVIAIAAVILLVTVVSPSQAKEFQSSWEVVESGTSEDLLTAAFFDGQVWAFGTGGVMLNSSNNGVTWEIADSPTNTDIHHSDSGFGSLLIAGDSGLMLFKQDSDSEWLDISLPLGSEVNGVSLIGGHNVVAVGDQGTIWKYDTGVWEVISLTIESDLMAVSFVDEELGIVVGSGGTILFSDDGGENWDYREAPEGASEAVIISVEFYSPTRIYAITDDGRILISMNNVVSGTEVGYLWELVDFERHYPPGSNEYLLEPATLDVELTTVEVVTTSKLLMTGVDGYLSMSVNGGTIVSQQINPLGNDTSFNDIVMLTGFIGVAVGDGGAILWTEEAGADDQVGFVVPEYNNFGVFVDETKAMFLAGFIATVKIVAFGIILGFFLGITLAMCKTSPTSLRYIVERFDHRHVRAMGIPILAGGLYQFYSGIPGTRDLGLQGIEYIFLPVGAPESFARILLGIALTFVGVLFLSNDGKFAKIKIKSFTLNPWRVRPLNTIATVYTDFFRNTPLIVQFLFIHFGVRLGALIQGPGLDIFSFENLEQNHNFLTDIFATYDHSEGNYGTLIGGMLYDSAFISAICALGFNSGAYQCETIRGAIQAIPSAQMEAGRSIGLTYLQTMRRVIMPQAIRICIPPMGNEMVNLVLNSSLAMIIGYAELTRQGKLIVASTFQYAYAWGMVLISYFVVTWTLALFLRWMEEKTRIPGLGMTGGD
ncbi:MAG: ABC transporter permease subunit [Candidatus Thalassarchaeum sp.]|nr:ABC transporter permease subunit [Candidatus Thalassarchaeum sp.]